MNFTLRPFTINDTESLARHANNVKIARFMTNQFPHPYSLDNAKAFISFATKDTPLHIFAIDVQGEAVGGIGIHPQSDIYEKNAELGYWLSESFWGKGIVTAAVKQMVEYGFKSFDITRIFARPFGTNLASQKVLQKAGFILEAKFEKSIFKNGIFDDELIFAVRLSENKP